MGNKIVLEYEDFEDGTQQMRLTINGTELQVDKGKIEFRYAPPPQGWPDVDTQHVWAAQPLDWLVLAAHYQGTFCLNSNHAMIGRLEGLGNPR